MTTYMMRLYFPIVHAVDPDNADVLLCGRSALFPPCEPNIGDGGPLLCRDCAEILKHQAAFNPVTTGAAAP